MVLCNILALCIVSQHVAHKLAYAWCSQFVSSFQGYEGSLIKLTSKQVCNVFLLMSMNLRIRASLSLSPCCHCSYYLKLLLINTSHFLASLFTYAVPPPPPSLDYEGLAPSDRKYLEKRDCGDGGESVVPACLWQSDSMLVVADSRPWWDVWRWEIFF